MDTIRLDREIDAVAHLTAITTAGELPSRSLLVVFTDDDAMPVLAVGIDDVPVDPPQHARFQALRPLLHLGAGHGYGGALLAVARRGDPRAQGGDLAWHDAFATTTRNAGLACHGTYVVTPAGIRRVRPRRGTVAA
ncbi:MAG: hypothetical protein ACRDWI_18725 [Jiangellaceae bacterium]